MRRRKLDSIIAVSPMTAKDIAEKAGIHPTHLSKIRGGAAVTNPTMETISEALNKTPKQIFGREYTGDKGDK